MGQSTAPIIEVGPESIAGTHLPCLLSFLESPPCDQGGLSGGVTQTFIPEGCEPLVSTPLSGVLNWQVDIPANLVKTRH